MTKLRINKFAVQRPRERERRVLCLFTQRHFSNYEFCGKRREKEKLGGKRKKGNMKYESAERKPLGDHL